MEPAPPDLAVKESAILFACTIALERGATATGIQQVPGRLMPNGGTGDPAKDARTLLTSYARII